MGFRNAPNKGIVKFPTVFHMRITADMKQEIISRGGADWLRSLVKANTRVPENVVTIGEAERALRGVGAPGGGDGVSPAIEGETSRPGGIKKRVKRDTERLAGKSRRRVSLDKRKS